MIERRADVRTLFEVRELIKVRDLFKEIRYFIPLAK